MIHYSDYLISDYIDWLKEQTFYEDTAIILVGDHLSMDRDYFDDIPTDYERTIFNLFINGSHSPAETNNRLFSSLDIFPTTLAALGADIDGERLGLGTNLFSEKETLIEELGYNEFYTEMGKRSNYYNQVIKQNTDIEIETRQ